MTTEAPAHADRAAEQDHLFTLDPQQVYPVLEHADGVHVWDTDGNQYVDAVAGLGPIVRSAYASVFSTRARASAILPRSTSIAP